jgi:5-methylcytosine-specific restriction endonuclease McrA
MLSQSTPDEKQCSRCPAVKPLTEFFRNSRMKDGRWHHCKECETARRRSSSAYAEAQRRYWLSEKCLAKNRRWHNSPRGMEIDRERRLRPGRQAWLKAHGPAYVRKWVRTPKGREASRRNLSSAKHKAWRAAWQLRPDVRPRLAVQWRTNYNRRKTLKLGLPATFTSDEWLACLAAFDQCCVYCGTTKRIEQDHFIPLKLGGAFTADNIVPACKPCNLRKLDKSPEVWVAPETYARVQTYFTSLARPNSDTAVTL